MDKIQTISLKIVESKLFRNFILGIILLSGVIVGIETYPGLYQHNLAFFHVADQLIIGIFVLEIMLKILSFGTSPLNYFRDPWNLFDFVIVAVCFIPNVDTHFVTVLRLARILRVFRIISVLPKLQILVNALLKSIPSMGYVVVLLSIVFYIYAVAGSFLFGKSDPVHFGSLHISMISLFKVLTLEGWTDIMNIQLYGTSDPTSEYARTPDSYASVAYFVSFILFGAMIIMNLFIGVIMNSMQESQDEIKKALLKKTQSEPITQQLVEGLEEKIDGLKIDIQRLNENLKSKNYG
jgi:voltage-gated sodium channel